MRICLIDTGPFVSYLDRNDPHHDEVGRFISGFKGQLVTTGAVIGEVMYFVSELSSGPLSFAEFLLKSDAIIGESMQPKLNPRRCHANDQVRRHTHGLR
jgi:predicted nucleic acid-binding protein